MQKSIVNGEQAQFLSIKERFHYSVVPAVSPAAHALDKSKSAYQILCFPPIGSPQDFSSNMLERLNREIGAISVSSQAKMPISGWLQPILEYAEDWSVSGVYLGENYIRLFSTAGNIICLIGTLFANIP